MNFAYGGTGVFPIVDVPEPNMTTQIDFFQDIIHEKFYSGSDLHSSVALVSVAGNDYSNYIAFMAVFKNKGEKPGSSKFENPLKPCCAGISTAYSCGSVDANGAKKYAVCDDPEAAFFWDTVHPTQEGWRAVYSALLQEL
ncbi:hypothetical protein OIU78_017767 [Salix suchowensis]|nr:hypothetical protein OIU78_017767 [Salix suchowensis]